MMASHDTTYDASDGEAQLSKSIHKDQNDIESSQLKDDHTDDHTYRPIIPLPFQIHPSSPRKPSRRQLRKEKIIGLKDAGYISSSWKARRKEFLRESYGINASTDTIYGPPAASHTTTDPLIMTIEEKEKQVRAMENKNPLSLLILGNLAAFKVMIFYLISLETLITCALTVALTVFWYNIGMEHGTEAHPWKGSGMDFIILAFAVTSPVRYGVSRFGLCVM